MKCRVCGIEPDFLFSCPECDDNLGYCQNHRNNHQHSNSNFIQNQFFQRTRQPRKAKTISNYMIRNGIDGSWTSGKEWVDLIIASLVITFAIGFYDVMQGGDWRSLVIISLIVSIGFIVHEMAHKYTAIHYGHDSRFVIFVNYVAMSIIFALIGFSFILVGAAVFLGVRGSTGEEVGKIGAIGPLSNFVLGMISLLLISVFSILDILSFHILGFSILYILVLSTQLNGFIGAFNMIPFGMLDGKKVFDWNKLVWLVITAGNVILYLFI